MKINTKFSIGDVVCDKVTGYSGTVTAVTVHMHSPITYLVEDIDETGRPIGDYIVEDRLEICDEDDDDIPCDGDCENCDRLPDIPDFLKPENLKNSNKEINAFIFKNDKVPTNHFPSKIERLKIIREAIDQMIKEASNKDK